MTRKAFLSAALFASVLCVCSTHFVPLCVCVWDTAIWYPGGANIPIPVYSRPMTGNMNMREAKTNNLVCDDNHSIITMIIPTHLPNCSVYPLSQGRDGESKKQLRTSLIPRDWKNYCSPFFTLGAKSVRDKLFQKLVWSTQTISATQTQQ